MAQNKGFCNNYRSKRGLRVIKAVKIKEDDWAELSRLAALKQLTVAKLIPLHDVISDIITKHKEELEYHNNKNMCKLK